jgi:peptide/nickel transport system substrate-binding protein
MKRYARRPSVWIALATATVLVAAACSGGSGGSGTPSAGGDLMIGVAQDAVSMNATNTFDNNSIFIFEQIMQPLFTVTPDGKGTQPLLATGFTLSPDNLTYTIKLRPDVKFSSGAPMTSADVKFSIDADTKTGDSGWGYINAAIDNVAAPDPSTVVVKVKYPWAPLIADLSLFSNGIVPNNYGGQSAADFYTHPVGTGPFMWGEWQKGRFLKLVKNPNYWEAGLPHLNSVQWNVIPDDNTRMLQLQSGQVQIDALPTWSTMNALKSQPTIHAQTFPSTELDYIAMNEQKEPFGDVHIRRAISYAIDRKALVSTALFGQGAPANSLFMPGVPFYDQNTKGLQFDVAAAKQEMAQSSKPNGFTTTLAIQSGNSTEQTVAQIVQSELKDVGITVNIAQIDPTTQHAQVQQGNYEMAMSIWTMDIADPDEWVTFAVNPNGGSHSAFTYYDNPAVIGLAKQGQSQTDPAQRQRIYSDLQNQVAADAPLAWLYYVPYAYPSSTKVSGFSVTPLGNYPLQGVSLSK